MRTQENSRVATCEIGTELGIKTKQDYPPPSLADAKAALKFIDADCDHDLWVKIGMALKSEFDDDEAYSVFEEWSKTGDKYNSDSLINTWTSIGEKANNGDSTTIRTLFYHAKENGYKSGSIDPNEQAIKLPIHNTVDATSTKKTKPVNLHPKLPQDLHRKLPHPESLIMAHI